MAPERLDDLVVAKLAVRRPEHVAVPLDLVDRRLPRLALGRARTERVAPAAGLVADVVGGVARLALELVTQGRRGRVQPGKGRPRGSRSVLDLLGAKLVVRRLELVDKGAGLALGRLDGIGRARLERVKLVLGAVLELFRVRLDVDRAVARLRQVVVRAAGRQRSDSDQQAVEAWSASSF